MDERPGTSGTPTVSEALRKATARLRSAGVPTPRLDAEVLLAHVLATRREHLYAYPERSLAPEERAAYDAAVERRMTRLPVAYITGKKEFMSLEFLVDENVLIPRPETETLVEAVIVRLRDSPGRAPGAPADIGTVADIGTGSGSIAVSIARFVEGVRVVATDISPQALAVARENARRNGVAERIVFLEGDLLSPLAQRGLEGRLLAVVSNPPYLSRRAMASLPPEVAKEPRVALAGGEAGLDFSRAILAGARAYLARDGFVALEVGEDQAAAVSRLAREEFGYDRTETIADYGGVPRAVIAYRGPLALAASAGRGRGLGEHGSKRTEVVRLDPGNPDVTAIRRAARVIREGGLVAFPTETVYGLGANGLSAAAVNRIFVAKGRPQDNPLILHVSEPEHVERVASRIPAVARRLIERFWPGPLTIVLPKRPEVPDAVTAGLETVGVRMPDNTIALALIAESGVPIAAPSANTSGRPSPTAADHVLADLGGLIDVILDGGPTCVGVESTVLDVTRTPPMILRPGGVTPEQLADAIGSQPAMASAADLPAGGPAPSPGMRYAHYAPRAPVILVEGEPEAVARRILEEIRTRRAKGLRVGVMCSSESRPGYVGRADVVRAVGSRRELPAVAAALFHTLRAFDADGVDVVLAEGFEEVGLGFAIMNRLRRAAGGRIVRAWWPHGPARSSHRSDGPDGMGWG